MHATTGGTKLFLLSYYPNDLQRQIVSFRDLLIDHQIELDNFLQNRLQFLLKCISRCDTYMINMIYSNKKEAIIKIAKNFSFVLSILIRNVFALVFMELETSSTYTIILFCIFGKLNVSCCIAAYQFTATFSCNIIDTK